MATIISEEMRYPTAQSKKKKKWMTFICLTCNQVASKWYDASMWNCKCTPCSKGRRSTEDFIGLAKEVHGETYDYSKTVYVDKRTPVSIVCSTHGEFTQRPPEHLEGHGCRKCGDAKRNFSQALDKTVWINRLSEYPLIKFKDANQIHSYHKKVSFVCTVHGEFTAGLGQVGKAAHLCPDCARVHHQNQSIRPSLVGKDATLYYVYLPKIDMYKLGVTVQAVNTRLSGEEYTLLLEKTIEYSQGLRIEHKLHTELAEFRYQGRKKLLAIGGNTELYKVDIFYYLKRALHL